jgi:hypothetical protein
MVMLAFWVGIYLFLISYRSLLTAQGKMLWGPLTLGFSGLTGLKTWSTLDGRKMLKAQNA